MIIPNSVKISACILLGILLEVIYFFINKKLCQNLGYHYGDDYLTLLFGGTIYGILSYFKKEVYVIVIVGLMWYLVFFQSHPELPYGNEFDFLYLDAFHPWVYLKFGLLTEMSTKDKYFCLTIIVLIKSIYFYFLRKTTNYIFNRLEKSTFIS